MIASDLHAMDVDGCVLRVHGGAVGPSFSTPCKLSAFGYSGGSARIQMLAVSSRGTTAINTTTAGLVNDSMRNDGFRWLVTGEYVHVNSPSPI